MEAAPIPRTDEPVDEHSVRLDSVALSRLMEEVRNDAVRAPSAYNRMHNRHNR